MFYLFILRSYRANSDLYFQTFNILSSTLIPLYLLKKGKKKTHFFVFKKKDVKK